MDPAGISILEAEPLGELRKSAPDTEKLVLPFHVTKGTKYQKVNETIGLWVRCRSTKKEEEDKRFSTLWQRYGIDFIETFATVVKPMIYHVLFALAA